MTQVARATQMIGRDEELGVLLHALDDGARGKPRALVVKGEAGIGKTLLVREFMRIAEARPAPPETVVTMSQCVDLGTIGAPFVPIRRLLHDLLAKVGRPAFEDAAGGQAVLATLGALVPELEIEGPRGASHSGDYVAEAIERLLEGLSQDLHLVIVIEDIHWADAATLSLLRTLSSTLRGAHLTLVATYRTEEVTKDAPARALLTELERNRAVDVFALPRLGRESLEALAAQLVGRPLTSHEMTTLEARSEGVPFFVEELLDIAQADLPETLRDVILARVDRLPDEARRVVQASSVCGVAVSHTDLAAIWDGEDADLTSGLRDALDGHVLVAENDRYRFRHALIREAMLDEMLPPERAEMHRRIAKVLQARLDWGDRSSASAAAEHWLAAGDREAAFDATVSAMTFARATLSIESAARLGERLLDLWHEVAEPEVAAGIGEHELYLQVARDYASAHQLRDCMRVVERAIPRLPPERVHLRVELLFEQIQASLETEQRQHLVQRLDEVDALLEGLDDAESVRLHALALSYRAAHVREGDRMAMLDEAIALAESVGSQETVAHAMLSQARLRWVDGRIEEGLADLLRLEPLLEEGSELWFMTVDNAVVAMLMLGRFEESATKGLACAQRARELGRERAGAHVLSNTAEALTSAGRVDEGLAAARRSRALMGSDSLQTTFNALQIEGMALVWGDRIAECETLLGHSRDAWDVASQDLQWVGVANELLIDLAIAKAHDARAAERARTLEEAMPLLDPLAWEHAQDSPADIDVLLVSGAALLAEAQAHTSLDLSAPIERIEKLAARLAGGYWREILGPYVNASLHDAHGVPHGEEGWREAVRVGESGRTPRRLRYVARLRLAEALTSQAVRRDREWEEAIDLLRSVVAEAPGDGCDLVARWARELLARLGARGTTDAAPLGELTERERQVLTLVADGLTNAAIAKRLFISPKTVSVHVSSILAKTGASNRAQAAVLLTGESPTQLAAPRPEVAP
ncbi:AAA family ATPase [Demequina sp. NBRC 110054]|uniref:helix-turn-helix transcriptional regulator n=1 Tax=Demequina sp. NBRC 110054 TaxID=1570343 RepID=UPI0009FCA2EA|nr:AAA family ATPase [Demequina sp. NBRC 110054]